VFELGKGSETAAAAAAFSDKQ